MKKRTAHKYLSLTAFAAALMLVGMLGIGLLNQGLTAQDFELFDNPQSYAGALLAVEGPLRTVMALDNLFLIFYTAAFVFLAISVWRKRSRPLVIVALGAMLVTAYLDLHENHSIMAFIGMANSGVDIGAEMLFRHSVLSQLKFHGAYLGFFLFAFVLPDDTTLEKLLRWTLLLVFAPVGILVYTHPSMVLSLLRYALMLSGLLLLAWNYWLRAQKKGAG